MVRSLKHTIGLIVTSAYLIYLLGLIIICVMYFFDFLSGIVAFIAILTSPIIIRIVRYVDKYFKEPDEFDSPDWYWKVPAYFSNDGIITMEEMKSLQDIFIKELNLDIANVKAEFEIKKFDELQKIANIFIRQSGYEGEIGNISDFCENASWYVCQIIIEYLKCKTGKESKIV